MRVVNNQTENYVHVNISTRTSSGATGKEIDAQLDQAKKDQYEMSPSTVQDQLPHQQQSLQKQLEQNFAGNMSWCRTFVPDNGRHRPEQMSLFS